MRFPATSRETVRGILAGWKARLAERGGTVSDFEFGVERSGCVQLGVGRIDVGRLDKVDLPTSMRLARVGLSGRLCVIGMLLVCDEAGGNEGDMASGWRLVSVSCSQGRLPAVDTLGPG